MSTFSSLIPAGAVTPSPRALAVVLLDRAGVDPDAIKSGVTVIGCTGDVVDFVADAIDHLVFGGQSDTPTWEAPSAEAQSHILSGDVDGSKFLRTLSFGKPVVVVARSSRLPEGADIQADRRCDIASSLTDDVISDVVRLVTGDAVDCAGLADAIGMNEMIGTARGNLSGSLVVERLRAIAAKKVADDAAKKAALEQAAAAREASKVAPVADAAKPVVAKLSDLTGFGAAREWGLQLATDLRDYRAGRLAWEDCDRGVLLHGAPGTGKTFYAKALAAECDVPLIAMSYTEMEAKTGSGNLIAKAIKELFKDARKNAPCIVFIDELDSIQSRTNRNHNSSWFTVVVNALLAELDGAEPRDGVVVIGATNLPDRIDPALLRPGRLERTVEIPLPSMSEIGGIIAHHCPDIPGDLDAAARACRGMSPATVAHICREARRAARRERIPVSAFHVEAAAVMSRPKRDDALDRAYCLHEAAHAVVSLAVGLDVQYVDADAGECCVRIEPLLTRAQMEAHIVGTLAARRADAMIGSGAHSGAVVDLATATSLARKAVAQFGMGAGVYHHSDQEASLLEDVRGDVMELLETLDIRAARLVDSNREAILAVAEALREKRYLDADEVAVLVREASPEMSS